MGRKRRRQQNDGTDNQMVKKRQHIEELPEGVHHYGHISEVPSEIQQYTPPKLTLSMYEIGVLTLS